MPAENLSQRYDYLANRIVVPGREELEEFALFDGWRREVINSGLVIDNQKVIFDIVAIRGTAKTSVALTALLEQKLRPIGFRDFRVTDMKVSVGDSPFGRRGESIPDDLKSKIPHKYGVPYPLIRLGDNNDHGIVVSPNYRKNGLGKSMFFTSLELAKILGAEFHIINKANDGTARFGNGEYIGSFYSQFAKTNLNDIFFVFELTGTKRG